jgi:hypothetical protein
MSGEDKNKMTRANDTSLPAEAEVRGKCPSSPIKTSLVMLNMVMGDLSGSPPQFPRHNTSHGSRSPALLYLVRSKEQVHDLPLKKKNVLQAGSRSRGSLPVCKGSFGKHQLGRTLPSFLEEASHRPSRLIRRIK